ncbi:MAG: Hpt domain-containing protein [Bacteroidota bacterium]
MEIYQNNHSLASSAVQAAYLDADTREALIDLMDGDAEMIIDLVDTLVECTPELMTELEAGVIQKDADQIRNAAHALKSSNAQLGAMNFAAICGELEELARQSKIERAEAILSTLQQELLRVNQALEAWKQDLMLAS